MSPKRSIYKINELNEATNNCLNLRSRIYSSCMLLRVIAFFFLLLIIVRAHAEESVPVKNFADLPEVKNFITKMVNKHKFSKATLVELFSKVKARAKIIRSIKSPIELNPWLTYRQLYLTEARINNGVNFWEKYEDALTRAEKIYGVPASIIVATIGIESRYGKNKGEFLVVEALTNLAFGENKSRNQFFSRELEEFLLLTREQHLNPLNVFGSYAGAIGQPQFMPSSYRYYAVPFSGNATIDLTDNEIDVIGSIANYYHKNGWQIRQPITIPVSMRGGKYQFSLLKPKNISLFELIEEGKITDLQSLGNKKSKIIELQANYGKEYWFVLHNFDVIKRYNHNNLYAMAVYQLSYHIATSRGKKHA